MKKLTVSSLLTAAALLISTSSFAAIYYQNDFNNQSAGALSLDSSWQIMSSGGIGNSAAIRLTYAKAGTSGTQAVLPLSSFNTQAFWLEFDTKIDGTMNGGMKFVKIFGSLNTASQNNSTFIMDYNDNIINRVCYYGDTVCEKRLDGSPGYDAACHATPVKTVSSIDLRGGAWHHVKIHFVRAAPGTDTGEYQIWIDGVEKVHFTNVNNNSPADSATSSISAITFGDYTNSNNSTWYYWIDNLSVSSTDLTGSSTTLTPPANLKATPK